MPSGHWAKLVLGKRMGRNTVGRIREIQFREEKYSLAKLVKARELAGRKRKEMQVGKKCKSN